MINQTEKQVKNYSTLIIFFLFCGALFLFSGFRVGSGQDYPAYLNIFDLINSPGGYWKELEPGFIILNKLSGLLTKDSQIIIVVSSFFTISIVGYKILKSASYPVLALFVFLLSYQYFQSFNLVRQYLAIVIFFCFAIPFIRSGNLLKYVMLVFLASSFHASAIVLLPLYFIRVSRLSFIFYISLFVLCILFYVLFPYINLFVFSLIGGYQEYSDYKEGSANYSVALTLLLIVPVFFNLKAFLRNDFDNRYLLAMVAISAVLMLLSHHNAIVHRISLYFNIFLVLLVPKILKALRGREQKLLYYSWCLFISGAHCFLYLSRNSAGVFPYSFDLSIGG